MNPKFFIEFLCAIGVVIALFCVAYSDLAKQFGYWGIVGMLLSAMFYVCTKSRGGAIIWSTAAVLSSGAAGGWLFH